MNNITLINVISIYLLLKCLERIYLLHSSEEFSVESSYFELTFRDYLKHLLRSDKQQKYSILNLISKTQS